jgi:hypothetical protein
MLNYDVLFAELVKGLKSQTKYTIITRSKKESKMVVRAMYYRMIKNGYLWYFNTIGDMEILVTRCENV